MGVLSNLEPAPVFRYFEEICGIPHGSSNTKAISDYCVSFAKEHGLRYIQDNLNNVIIFKEGTSGYEQSAPVMIQGHIDMVCEKTAECSIDFTKDGLELQLQDGIISAKGTTLGGDDGIAAAYALAILASDDIPHPPLEVVFTVDEEIGMLGAAAIDCSTLKSRTLLNLDSEDEGYLLVSCAGGITATGHLPVKMDTASGIKVHLKITGLLGGHSGIEIDKGRANACQLLGRTLYELGKTFSFQLISVNGGLKDNAIPREAEAELLLDSSADTEKFAVSIKNIEKVYMNEYQQTDPSIKIVIPHENASGSFDAMTADTTAKTITALVNLPGGIQRMSHNIDGLVQTSLNLGKLITSEKEVSFSFAVRSSVETEKLALVDRIRSLIEALGGSISCMGSYPAWEYRQDSPLRDLMVRIFEKQYGRKPVIQAIHAGVECGFFCGKMPGLDCVSFGPDMKDIHTPKESMDVESVRRTWEYTLEILKELQ